MCATMASLGKNKLECSVILFLIPHFSSWCPWAEMWHSTELPPACSVHHLLLFGGELFAVTEMLRNGIAKYGNRAFLCSVIFVFPLLMISVTRKEGWSFLLQIGKKAWIASSISSMKGLHPSEPGKSGRSVKCLQVTDMWQAWSLWLRGSHNVPSTELIHSWAHVSYIP